MFKKISIILSLTIGLFHFNAFADHNDPEYELVDATNRLENTVRYSYLRYRVKQSVFRFANLVRTWERCGYLSPGRIGFENFSEEAHGGGINKDHNDPPRGYECRGLSYRLQNSFREVSRYLHDTYYDFPSVYYAYRDVDRLFAEYRH